MLRGKAVCALALCVLAMPTAAGAQDGNGPYAPFPSAPSGGGGDAWYALMNADIPSVQLDDGAFAGALRPAAAAPLAGPASARAGLGVAGTSPTALLAALALAGAAVGLTVLVARRARA